MYVLVDKLKETADLLQEIVEAAEVKKHSTHRNIMQYIWTRQFPMFWSLRVSNTRPRQVI